MLLFTGRRSGVPDPANNSQLSSYARASDSELAEAAEAASGVKGP